MSNWLNWVGLARRAGSMAPGHNQVEKALRNGEAKLIIIAEDAGPSVDRKYHLWAQDLGVPLIRAGTKETLGRAMGMGPHAVLAILDKNISQRILASGEFSGGSQRGRKGQSTGIRVGKGTEAGQSPAHRSASSTQSGKHQESHEHRGTGSRANGSKHYGGEIASGAKTRRGGQNSSPTGGQRNTAPLSGGESSGFSYDNRRSTSTGQSTTAQHRDQSARSTSVQSKSRQASHKRGKSAGTTALYQSSQSKPKRSERSGVAAPGAAAVSKQSKQSNRSASGTAAVSKQSNRGTTGTSSVHRQSERRHGSTARKASVPRKPRSGGRQ